MFAALLAQSSLGSVAADIVSQTLSRLLEEIDPDNVTLAKLIEAVKTRPVIPRRPALPPPEDGSGTAERPIYFPPNNGKEQFPVAQPDEAERERMRFYYARAAIPASVVRRRDLGIRIEHIEAADAWRKEQVTKIEIDLAEMEKRGPEAQLSRDERDIVTAANRRLLHLRRQLAPEPPGLTHIGEILKSELAKLGRAMKLHCTTCSKELNGDEIDRYTLSCMNAGRRNDPEPPRWCDGCTVPF